MRPYRHMGIMAMLAAGMVTPVATAQEPPSPPPQKPKRKEHKHSREIARRLRQQERAEAKRAASVGRHAKRQDAEERLGPKDERAVPKADAQPLDISEQPQ